MLRDKFSNPDSRLYKKQWIYILGTAIFAIAFGLAILSFVPYNTYSAFFFVGLGFGLLICADVSRNLEQKLPPFSACY